MANTGCPDCRALVDQPQLTHHRAWHRSLDDALVRARAIADSATATADRALRLAQEAQAAVARLQAGQPAAATTAPYAAGLDELCHRQVTVLIPRQQVELTGPCQLQLGHPGGCCTSI